MYICVNIAQNLKRPQNTTGKINSNEDNMSNYQSRLQLK